MAERVPVVTAVMALVAAVVMALVLPESPLPDPPVDGRAAFVEAWERSRFGTYVLEQRHTRTLADGRSFSAEKTIVQRPPDRLEIGAGEVEGRLDGEILRCGADPAGVVSCLRSEPAGSYEDEVAVQIASLRGYVQGSRPLYRVIVDGDCFDLELALRFPTPPYGESARFCFDPHTGAPTLEQVSRPEATDVTEAVRLVKEVTAEDLTIPDQIGRPLGEG